MGVCGSGDEKLRPVTAIVLPLPVQGQAINNIVQSLVRGLVSPKVALNGWFVRSAAQLGRLADESGRYRSLVLLLGIGGLRWGEAAALRVSDIDFLRRQIHLHTNAVTVGSRTHLGTLKSNKNRTVALPQFVIDAIAQTVEGMGRDDLLRPSKTGGYLSPPSSHDSWLSGAVARCQKADETFHPHHGAHLAPHGGVSGDLSEGQSQGGAADARSRECRHDA